MNTQLGEGLRNIVYQYRMNGVAPDAEAWELIEQASALLMEQGGESPAMAFTRRVADHRDHAISPGVIREAQKIVSNCCEPITDAPLVAVRDAVKS